MATIKKGDMLSRANMAASKAPTLEDRLHHAASLANNNPAVLSSAPESAASPAQPEPQHTSTAVASTVATVAGNPIANPPQSISMDLIDENPFNARWIYRPERIMQLAASIAAHGQETPGIATIRNGRYVLAAGHYRNRALKQIAAKTMDLVIKENMTDQELYEASYRENHEREPQTAMDNAIAWGKLIEEGVYAGVTELATAIGQTQGYVSKVLAALKLHESVREIISKSPESFGATILYELGLYAGVAGQLKAEAAARQVLDGQLSRKDLQEARAAIETPKDRKQKEMARQYKIQGADGVELGSIKEWDSGRVMLDVSLPEGPRRAELMKVLREQFGITN